MRTEPDVKEPPWRLGHGAAPSGTGARAGSKRQAGSLVAPDQAADGSVQIEGRSVPAGQRGAAVDGHAGELLDRVAFDDGGRGYCFDGVDIGIEETQLAAGVTLDGEAALVQLLVVAVASCRVPDYAA